MNTDNQTTTTTVDDQIKQLTEQLKKLKAESRKPREIKGIEVEFKNKAGEEIKGKGVLYYVVRQNGKLHYKEASQVKVIEAIVA